MAQFILYYVYNYKQTMEKIEPEPNKHFQRNLIYDLQNLKISRQ